MRLSANLGFLWADLPLPDAIRAAARAGFDAVECHWPYDTDPGLVRAALAETGLPMLSLNTARGGAGEFGLSALPGREAEARAAIDAALDYAGAIGCGSVHVMAGRAQGSPARAAFVSALAHACDRAAARGIMVLIEPLNPHDAPGYFLNGAAQAIGLIRALGRANLKLMFDCYHIERIEGDAPGLLPRLLPDIGHVQIAAVPDRGPPDHGALDYGRVCALLGRLGWQRPVGAEYRVSGATEDSLGWMARWR